MERTLDQLLDLLGGDATVAKDLGCGQPAISNWKARGVPKGRWVDLVMLGAAKRIDPPITLEEVQNASGARSPTKEVEAA